MAFATAIGIAVNASYATCVGTAAGGSSLVPVDAFGAGALSSNQSGLANCAVGYMAANSAVSASFITAVGVNALISTVSGLNVAFGSAAGYTNTYARNNCLLGMNAGWRMNQAVTTDTYNTFVGNDCGYGSSGVDLTGVQNTGVGYRALYSATSGGYNTCVGYRSGVALNSGTYNTCLGHQAGISITTGTYNVFIGMSAGQANAATTDNIGIGTQALYGSSTSGSRNIGIGWHTGWALSTGTDNVFLGYSAARTPSTGSYNIAIGSGADCGSTTNDCIAIGHTAVAGTYDGNIQLGTGTNNRSEGWPTLQMGSANYRCYAVAWTSTSDERLKEDVQDLTGFEGLELVRALRPVSFLWKPPAGTTDEEEFRSSRRRNFGMIAQEVKKTMEELGHSPNDLYVDDDEHGWSLNYDHVVGPLVKAVQQLAGMVETLQAEVAALKG